MTIYSFFRHPLVILIIGFVFGVIGYLVRSLILKLEKPEIKIKEADGFCFAHNDFVLEFKEQTKRAIRMEKILIMVAEKQGIDPTTVGLME